MISMVHANELRNRKLNANGRKREKTLYCLKGPSPNKFLVKKYRRKILLATGSFAWLLNFAAKRLSMIFFYNPKDNALLFYEDLPPLIQFSPSELSIGSKFLESRGQSFVCLNVRDKSYNENFVRNFGQLAKNWSMRDSDIETYKNAMSLLTEMGCAVFRMGAKVEKRLEIDNPKIFDYATDGTRTEFLDFYLGSTCKFAISTASGWDEVPTVFRRPLLLVNVFDMQMKFGANCLMFPKLFVSHEKGDYLSLTEFLDLDSSVNTITVRDLTSEELVDAVTEMAQRVEGTFVETPEQKKMQAKAKQILSTHPKLQPSPNHYPLRAQFASCFLSRYPNFLK
ncbi:MAG: TIGR04372 family glycosyltransferase [Actinomycetota bacterium]